VKRVHIILRNGRTYTMCVRSTDITTYSVRCPLPEAEEEAVSLGRGGGGDGGDGGDGFLLQVEEIWWFSERERERERGLSCPLTFVH